LETKFCDLNILLQFIGRDPTSSSSSLKDFDETFDILEYSFVSMKISEEMFWNKLLMEELLKVHLAKFGFIIESEDKFGI
jgi:hypothetical protein